MRALAWAVISAGDGSAAVLDRSRRSRRGGCPEACFLKDRRQALNHLPRHVGIIMDGNGRWAVARGGTRADGHQQGAEAVRRTVRAARELGIPYLTLYAFSQ